MKSPKPFVFATSLSIAFALSASVCLAVQHAADAPESSRASALPVASVSQLGWWTKRSLGAVIVCVRSLVQDKKGGTDGIATAASYLENARANASSRSALNDIDRECESYRRAAASATVSRDEQWQTANQLSGNYSSATRNLIRNFVRPTINCKKGGLALNLGIRWGAGGKVDLNFFCKGTDGKRWSGISLGGGLTGNHPSETVVYGAQVNINGGSLEHQGQTGIADTSTTDAGDIGWGVDLQGEADGRPGPTHVRGYGLGVGGARINYHQVNLKLIPLGTDKRMLMDALLK